MIGPHHQRLAEIQHRYTSKQMLQRIQSRTDNPLQQIIQKLKRQFTEYQAAYSQDVMNQQIPSIDKLISHDSKLGPILSALQKENNILRRQLSILQTQLSNTVGICEQIMIENQSQKQIIIKKNEDIKKIIQTIATNESQTINDLQQKIELQQQENSILIMHLEEIKKQHEGYAEKFGNKQQQLLGWKRKWQQTRKLLNQSIGREHDLSRKLSLAENNVYQQSQSIYNLQQNIQTLRFENNQIKNQLLLIKDQSKHLNLDGIKKQMQAQYGGILQQHKKLKKQRQQLIRNFEKLKLENQKYVDMMNQIQRKNNKYTNDQQMTLTLLNQQKQKNAALSSTITKLQQKLDQLKHQNNQLNLQKQSSNSYAIKKQKILHDQIDKMRRQLDEKEHYVEMTLKDINDKTRLALQMKEERIQQLNSELKRALERDKDHRR